MSELFVNEKIWKKFSDIEMQKYIQDVFDYYRQNGFPFYPIDMISRRKEFRKLKQFDFINIKKKNIIGQSMHGLALAWSYHPHSWEVSCNNKKTPMGIYKDDELFLKCISKRLKMGTYMSNSGIRKMLRIMTGVQSVSNFRPTAAAVIYQKFAFGGVVWDMSGGWGGRMLGAIISDVKKYIVTEPSLKSYI